MKKLNKILLLIVSLFGITLMNVNATTYTNDKKINFKEFEEPVDARGLLKYENKSFIFEDTPFDTMKEIVDGDKISVKASEFTMQKVLDGMYPDEVISKYGWENGLYVYQYTVGGKDSGYGAPEVDKYPEVPEQTMGETWFNGFYNNKLYLVTNIMEDEYTFLDRYLSIYNEQLELQKTIKASDLIEEDSKNCFMYVINSVYSEEPFIIVELNDYKNDVHKVYVYNTNEELIMEISDEYAINEITPVYSNGELKFAFVTYEEEYSKSELKVTDGKEIKSIIKSEEDIYISNENGLIVVSNDRNIIYDSEFNLIKEYSNVEDIEVFKEITTKEEAIAMHFYDSVYKEVQNGNYLINLYTYDEEMYRNVVKSELMTIEDSKKASISGYIKDKDGNPLKDHLVELHSTPRTYTTDKDGYFKFDNVEEGKHTLIVKDASGKVLVTREINVIEGTETKLDNDTLYFNPSDNGFNLNIKIDGDKLVVDSVDKGVKEPSKNIIEKLEDVVVPKTFDGILAYILVFSTLIGTAVYLTRKNRRIKYTNIK